MIHRLACYIVAITFFIIYIQGSYCYASGLNLEKDGSKYEMDWDYLTPTHFAGRYIDTVSLHILEKKSEKNNRSEFRGITVTRPYGHIVESLQAKESSAHGIGPIYMVRNEKQLSERLYEAFDMSGGVIIYDKAFPAGGRYYNFMWRIGPRLIYKINESSSLNFGYMLMHVSNGLKTHNLSYNAHGVSIGFEKSY